MGWQRLRVRRGDMFRTGNTFGQGWNSVERVRLIVDLTEPISDLEVRFDELKQTTGPINGEVEYCYVYVRDDGDYLAKSAPSEISKRQWLENQGATVTIPADASRDSQVNKVWLFRRGAGLPEFYRVAEADVAGTGSVEIQDLMTAEDAIIVGILLEDDNDVPPDDIIDIEGPYYDRTFVLTSQFLHPSRRLNPDSFSAGQVIRTASADERNLWVRKTLGGLYIGTTRDVYALRGTGAELPDGTVDFVLQPLNTDNPPISEMVAQEGNFLVWLAADGVRGMVGGGTQLLVGMTSLLWKGYSRHGIAAINMAGRFRAAISRGVLTVIVPEGADTTDSSVLYRYKFDSKRWYRHTYANDWRCVYREPDGGLTASDDAGFVWVLDSGDGDDSVAFPIVLWSREDDIDVPFARKDPYDFRALINTGGVAASIAVHLDNLTSAETTLSANRSSYGESLFNLTELVSSFRNIQYRITGNFTSFRLGPMQLGYHVLPMLTRGHTTPHNFGHPGVKTIAGIQLRVCTLGAEVEFTPILDAVADTPFLVTSEEDEPINYTHMFDYPGRQAAEIFLKHDIDCEMYEWAPITSHLRPLGTLVYDTGPGDFGDGEFIWPHEVWAKIEAYADLYVEPWFDGQNYGALLVPVTPSQIGTAIKYRVPIPRGYKGRVPRFIITSCEPFFPYWVEVTRRQTRAEVEKPPLRFEVPFLGKAPA